MPRQVGTGEVVWGEGGWDWDICKIAYGSGDALEMSGRWRYAADC